MDSVSSSSVAFEESPTSPQAGSPAVDPSTVAAPPASPDFDFPAEFGQSLAKSMECFTGPAYVPVKRVLCRLAAKLVTETLIVLDDAMGEAVDLPEYNTAANRSREAVSVADNFDFIPEGSDDADDSGNRIREGIEPGSVTAEVATELDEESFRLLEHWAVDEFDRMFPGLPVVVVAADGTERTEFLPDPRAAFARQWQRSGGTVKAASAVKVRTTAIDPPAAESDSGLMRLAAMGSVPMKGGV